MGGTGYVYLAVEPPVDVIEQAVGDLVNELTVVVSDGNYADGVFTVAATSPSGAAPSTGAAGGEPATSAP